MAGTPRRRAQAGRGVESGLKRRRARRVLVLEPLTELHDPKRTLELAWAAGFFCGEGSFVSGWNRTDELWRVMFSIAQKSTKGRPEVLRRFQKAVGFGGLGGPYSRKTYRLVGSGAAATLRLAALLWPWLSRVKRDQAIAAFRKRRELLGGQALDRFLATHGSGVRPQPGLDTAAHRLAWAAGLFDGEGWTGYFTYVRKRGTSYKLGMSVRQSDRHGVPEVLKRFKAVAGVGTIDGPYRVKGRMPNYMWREPNRARIEQLVARLSPQLGGVKRAQARRAISHVTSTPRLSSAPPRLTQCHRGHPFPKERTAYVNERGWRQLRGCQPCRLLMRRRSAANGRVKNPNSTTTWSSVYELHASLAPIVRELGRMPMYAELRARGLHAVALRINTLCGLARTAKKLNLVPPSRVRRADALAPGLRKAA